jgi:hypothetical protein
MPVEGSSVEVPVEETVLEKTSENEQDTSTFPPIPILKANPDFNITLVLMLCILNEHLENYLTNSHFVTFIP